MGDVTVTIELCGRLADGLGREVELGLPQAGCTAQAFLERVAQHYPSLAEAIRSGRAKVCADERLLGPHDRVEVGANIALFPPVSGG